MRLNKEAKATLVGLAVVAAHLWSGNNGAIEVNKNFMLGIPGPGGLADYLLVIAAALIFGMATAYALAPWWAAGLIAGVSISALADRFIHGGGVDYLWYSPGDLIFNIPDVVFVVWAVVVVPKVMRR